MRNPRRVAAWALTVGMVGSTAAAVSAQEAGVDTITVALDGSGDFKSIAAAIDAANAGDSILIATWRIHREPLHRQAADALRRRSSRCGRHRPRG